jgi:hypothetical protein
MAECLLRQLLFGVFVDAGQGRVKLEMEGVLRGSGAFLLRESV